MARRLPIYRPRHDEQPHGCLFCMAGWEKHMDSGRILCARGMEAAGWLTTAGGGVGLGETDTIRVLEEHCLEIAVFWPRAEWDRRWWRGGTHVGPEHCFRRVEDLARRPDVLRVAVHHDAATNIRRSRRWHAQFRPHLYLTWYHPRSVLRYTPWAQAEQIVRTYHVVDPALVPDVGPRDGMALLSGAIGDRHYPLRTRLWRAVKNDGLKGVDLLPHPGYHGNGHATNDYLRTLSQYRVAICTASRHGFALRKIFEATAAGCRVITDLPAYDKLPEIDGNLVRIDPQIPLRDLADLIAAEADGWDLDRQRSVAEKCVARYSHLAECRRLSDELHRRWRAWND